jgi:hypothetical protein
MTQESTVEQNLRRLCELEPTRFQIDGGSLYRFNHPQTDEWFDYEEFGWYPAGYCLERMQERWKELDRLLEGPGIELCSPEDVEWDSMAQLFDEGGEQIDLLIDLTPSLILDYYVKWLEAKILGTKDI